MKNKIFGLLLLPAALGGCAVIDQHQKVAGWPELKVIEHYVAAPEMRERCRPYAPPFSVPLGCTLFYLDQSEAHIYLSKDFPAQWILEHERLHAAGYDHVGSTSMQQMLENWKRQAGR